MFYDSLTIVGNNGPIWTREFEPRFYDRKLIGDIIIKHEHKIGGGESHEEKMILYNHMCNQVMKTLQLLNVKRMVIGHNVQPKGVVTETCDSKLFKIDVGLSRAYGGSLGAIIIDIKTDSVTVV